MTVHSQFTSPSYHEGPNGFGRKVLQKMLPSTAEKSSVELLHKKAKRLPNDGVMDEEDDLYMATHFRTSSSS
jgi:hypothetical protein